MTIYDISQEIFSCIVYPGDPMPQRQVLQSMLEGALYNLTAFSMCCHNGTHLDAPAHFIAGGATVDEVPLYKCIGMAYVAECTGQMDGAKAKDVLRRAQRAGCGERILLKGDCVVTEQAAKVFGEGSIHLLGVESQSVGPLDAPMAAHVALLSAGTVLLEGIRLKDVPEGEYLLSAAPLNLGGAEGAPVRACLIRL